MHFYIGATATFVMIDIMGISVGPGGSDGAGYL